MKKYLNKTFVALIGLMTITAFIGGCKEDNGIGVNKIGAKPQPVSNVQVRPISGGAFLKFDLPLSEDLRYVKATYTLDNGIKREAKASIYGNEILVDGFGEAGEYDIELRSVAVGEVESDPVVVKASVLTPPFKLVLEKLKVGTNVEATFGGINIRYTNETKADIVIRVVRKNAEGKWQLLDSEYTNFESETFRIRGLEAGPADYGIFIEDRWNHFSDTLVVNLNPLEEILFQTQNWQRIAFPNDAETRGTNWAFHKLWDGNITIGNLTKVSPMPQSIVAIDLGAPALLSRLVLWTNYVSNAGRYGGAHIYDFAIYGSNNPDPSGDWDSWTLIDRFQGTRPSGAGFGVPGTTEEGNWLRDNGETYEFTDPTAHEKFRYIRFRVFATWNGIYDGDSEVYLNEMVLYGQQ